MSDEHEKLLCGDRPCEGDKFRMQEAESSLSAPSGSANCKLCGAAFTPIWLKQLAKMSTVCAGCVIRNLEVMVNQDFWPNDRAKRHFWRTTI